MPAFDSWIVSKTDYGIAYKRFGTISLWCGYKLGGHKGQWVEIYASN